MKGVWNLSELVSTALNGPQICINGKWVPCRPENTKKKYMSLKDRVHAAWLVFMCKADAVKWPKNQ